MSDVCSISYTRPCHFIQNATLLGIVKLVAVMHVLYHLTGQWLYP